jgi:stage V sporulation protein B
MTLIMRRLGDIGISSVEANRIYGAYTTLALPIFGLVPAFVPPITESLIPRLSAAVSANNRNEQTRAVSGAARLTVFLGMPASMGIALYSKDMIALLFNADKQTLELAAPLLSALGASVLFSCLVTATNAVLQSYRRVILPIISLGVGAAVKAISAYILIGNPDIGTLGAPISTLLCNVTVLAINLIFIGRRIAGRAGILSQLPKPFFASVVSMLASYAVYLPISRINGATTLGFLVALSVAAVMYITLCLMLGVVSRDDIKLIKKKKEN